MASNLWSAPSAPLLGGTSIAQNTFTAARDIPCGDVATKFPIVPGNTLQDGSMIHVEGWAVFSNTGTPTIILGLYWGLVAGTNLVVSAAKTTTTAASNWIITYDYLLRVVTAGTAGSMIGVGTWTLGTSATAWTSYRWPETAPAPITVDTTVSKALSLGVTWSASSASNTITLHKHNVEIQG